MISDFFKVIKPGACSLLQDEGRFGYQHFGITTGGAMDETAARWANRLLGNSSNAVLLEITLGNVQLEATADTWIALTGADLGLRINGEKKNNWQSHFVRQGDLLIMGWAVMGVSSYFAVVGGFQLKSDFGSCSTVKREQLGGLTGNALEAGDELHFSSVSKSYFPCTRAVPYRYIPDYSEAVILRVIKGYQAEQFPENSVKKFFASSYKVSPESDRMGFRLKGETIETGVSGLLSEGIAYGAIQIPADGQPIVLLKDRQTLGGYPKIGSVLPLDSYKLSQCRAGSEVNFKEVSLQEAQQLMQAFQRFFSIST
jgi:biotin-dependent carboxylase-like uncharacterized protein